MLMVSRLPARNVLREPGTKVFSFNFLTLLCKQAHVYIREYDIVNAIFHLVNPILSMFDVLFQTIFAGGVGIFFLGLRVPVRDNPPGNWKFE